MKCLFLKENNFLMKIGNLLFNSKTGIKVAEIFKNLYQAGATPAGVTDCIEEIWPGLDASRIFKFLISWNEFVIANVVTRTTASKTFLVRLILPANLYQIGEECVPCLLLC